MAASVHRDVLVVGAGASGIGAAIRLAKAGVSDFAVLVKAAEPGGTWRNNTYPGCACDVSSALYSYSFAPNPEWNVRELGHGWSSVDVRPEVQDTYNAELQRALRGTVYDSGGCSRYYLDANGRNSFSWPYSTGRMRRRISAFDESSYRITGRGRTRAGRLHE